MQAQQEINKAILLRTYYTIESYLGHCDRVKKNEHTLPGVLLGECTVDRAASARSGTLWRVWGGGRGTGVCGGEWVCGGGYCMGVCVWEATMHVAVS